MDDALLARITAHLNKHGRSPFQPGVDFEGGAAAVSGLTFRARCHPLAPVVVSCHSGGVTAVTCRECNSIAETLTPSPLPWKAIANGHDPDSVHVVAANGFLVAKTNRANANLIVTAANAAAGAVTKEKAA